MTAAIVRVLRSVGRASVRILLVLVAVLLLPVASAVAQVSRSFPVPAAIPASSAVAPRPIAYDPAKPTAVVVVGVHGAEVSDLLAPYEVLAASGRFNVYTVAPAPGAVPLTGGLDLVPDLTFDGLSRRLSGRAPDLVVVPAMPDFGQPSLAPVTGWLRTQAGRGSLIESVCVGSGILASAGLLDGRPATTHWGRLAGFRSAYPAVRWLSGRRWVDDGSIVTAGGVLSGIDATLHVTERLAGPAAAVRAAAEIGWPYYAPGRATPPVVSGPALSDLVFFADAGFGWDKQRIGIVLTPGVGEVELASVFDTYGGDSAAARLEPVSLAGGPIRSRHGLTFLPGGTLAAAAPHLDRVLVPGAAAARASGMPVIDGLAPDYLQSRGGFAYDAAISDLAAHTDVATSRWAARAMELPLDGVTLRGPAWPWPATLRAARLSLLGLALLLLARYCLRARRRRP